MGRSIKGHCADCSTGFMKLVNALVALGAIPTIVLPLVVNARPTLAGVALIVLAIWTVLSGFFGAVFSGQGACFGCHLFLLLTSTMGLFAAALAIFVNPGKINASLNPTIGYWDALNLVKIEGIVFMVLFCLQILILVMACLVTSCGLNDYYEDLESAPSARELARMQREEEKKRQKKENSSSSQIAQKMKEKYGSGRSTDGL